MMFIFQKDSLILPSYLQNRNNTYFSMYFNSIDTLKLMSIDPDHICSAHNR